MASRIAMYARFIRGMPSFLEQRVTPDEARREIVRRMANREKNFLALVGETVFARRESPYRFIMKEAGCEPGDIEKLVNENGLDDALGKLYDAGLRVSFDEFKGRKPIVRGGRTLDATAESFDNPLAAHTYESESSGSSGRPLGIKANLAHIASQTYALVAGQEANGTLGAPVILYRPGMPCTVAINNILRQVTIGNPVRRWFSPVTASATRSPVRFRLAGAVTPVLVRACGAPFPKEEHVPFSDAVIVARAAAAFVREEGRCLVKCPVSSALAVSLAAMQEGLDLTGVVFNGGGEPASLAKIRGIAASGARYVTSYAMTEAGTLGICCPNSEDPTDVHMMSDRVAAIRKVQQVAGVDDGVGVLHYTTLLPTAPKILINVSSDDFGILEERDCGCMLGGLGLRQHVRQIRSVGKLTGRGITLVASDIAHIIEEVLPQKFGGSPQDYQLVEEEERDGSTHLNLLVSPSIALSSETEPGQVLLEWLSRGSPGAALQSATLRSAQAVKVKRQQPKPSSRGKLPAFKTVAAR
jgi:hypothetical protein